MNNDYHFRAYLYGDLASFNYDIANNTVGQHALTFECSNKSTTDALSKLTTAGPDDVIYCTIERGKFICVY